MLTIKARRFGRIAGLAWLLLASTSIAAERGVATWTDNSDNETSFVLERCLVITTGTFCSSYLIVGTPSANITSFTDNSVAFPNCYNYRIKAVNSEAESGYSNIAVYCPPKPQIPNKTKNVKGTK
jgi:hypothetical protein